MVALSVMLALVGCGSSVRWELLKGDCVPNGEEVWYDCIDQDCDENDGDRDGDNYVDAGYSASCADWATINPGKDVGDCWDDSTDADPDYLSTNGYPELQPSDVHPGAKDVTYDGVDAACDGDAIEFDADQDGWNTNAYADRDNERGEDCDDANASINPGALEVCDNGRDDNCDEIASPCDLEGDFTINNADLTISGSTTADGVGFSLEGGDMNGDGISDLLISALHTDSSFTNAGAAYVIYGPITNDKTLPTDADLTLNGSSDDEAAGHVVSASGDADGDGINDMLIANLSYDRDALLNAGGVSMFYGSTASGGRRGTFTLASADVFWMGEATSDFIGASVQFVGDLDGDGGDEFALGSNVIDVDGKTTGGVYLVLGSSYSGTLDLADEATLIYGNEDDDCLGYRDSVSDPVDFDGDGFADLVLGAFLRDWNGSETGSLYVAYDTPKYLSPGTEQDIADVADAEFYGENVGDRLGEFVRSAGDIDADSVDDIVVGSPASEGGAGAITNAGCVWVLTGGTRYSGQNDISTVAFASICGSGDFDVVGRLAFGGDLNGDDYADVIVGSDLVDDGLNDDAGAAYVFFGPIVSGSYATSDADATITGDQSDEFRGSAGAIIDIDSDGDNDLLIGGVGSSSGVGDNNIIVFSGSDF